jgi:predicted nucleotidyltransferase
MPPNEPTEIVRRSQELLRSEPGSRLALIYGSFASGKMRPDSDVDIAVLFDRPLDAKQKMDLAERLGKELSKTVDLADLFSLNGTILRQILCTGHVLVKNDPAALLALTKRMIYNQADMMPLVRRTLQERQRRFCHG